MLTKKIQWSVPSGLIFVPSAYISWETHMLTRLSKALEGHRAKGTELPTQSENKALPATSKETLSRGSWPGWAWKGKQPTVCGGRCSGHDHRKQTILFIMCIAFFLSYWILGRGDKYIFSISPCNTVFHSIIAYAELCLMSQQEHNTELEISVNMLDLK